MAQDLRKFYKTDEKLEVEGVWETLPNGSQVKVARAGNDAFMRAYNELPAGVQEQIDTDEDAAREVMADLLARTILVDWKEVYIDGENVPYDQDLAKELLRDLKDFRNDVWQIAQNRQKYRDQQVEKNAKKSKSASSGNSNTQKT